MRIHLPKETKRQAVTAIRAYFLQERDEDIGALSAELLLDFFLNTVGPSIYNLAIADAGRFLTEKVEDLSGLEKPVPLLPTAK